MHLIDNVHVIFTSANSYMRKIKSAVFIQKDMYQYTGRHVEIAKRVICQHNYSEAVDFTARTVDRYELKFHEKFSSHYYLP